MPTPNATKSTPANGQDAMQALEPLLHELTERAIDFGEAKYSTDAGDKAFTKKVLDAQEALRAHVRKMAEDRERMNFLERSDDVYFIHILGQPHGRTIYETNRGATHLRAAIDAARRPTT